jgi:hypothetical protein
MWKAEDSFIKILSAKEICPLLSVDKPRFGAINEVRGYSEIRASFLGSIRDKILNVMLINSNVIDSKMFCMFQSACRC